MTGRLDAASTADVDAHQARRPAQVRSGVSTPWPASGAPGPYRGASELFPLAAIARWAVLVCRWRQPGKTLEVAQIAQLALQPFRRTVHVANLGTAVHRD